MSERAESVADGGRVTVVGTAHVSGDSVREVEEAVETHRPDVVAVELDEGRYRQLRGETPEDLDAGDLLRGNTVFQFVAYWMLSYVQTRLGEKFDVSPGADMKAAIDAAEELGIDVALVDREIQTTIRRFWRRMTLTEKLRMVGSLLFGVTDYRVAGLTLGLFVGLILGPVVGLFGDALGVTGGVLVRATGGVLIAVAVGFLIDAVGDAALDPDAKLLASLGGGVLAGGLLGVGLGLADGIVTTYLGGPGSFVVTAIGSVAIGLTAGLLAGVVAGVALGVGGGDRPEEEFEELDMSELTDTDVVTVMMEEFREFSPGGAEALIDERDAYIAHQLVALRRQGRHVVAVVGAGHRKGIERYLANPETLPPMESLVGEAESSGIPWLKLIGVAFSVGFVAFFVLLAMAGVRNEFLLRLFGAWFLVNGAFAFTFAKLGGARWDSALVGGAVAWMTSINPLLAPGWFAGYVELLHSRVNVADISRLNELLSDEETPIRELLSRMLDVPLFRLIAVVALTNVGSIVASLLFVAYVLPLFGTELGGVDGVTNLMVEGARNSARLVWEAVA